MGACASALVASGRAPASLDGDFFDALRAVEDAADFSDLFTKLPASCHALLQTSVSVLFLIDPKLSFVAVHSVGKDAAVFRGVTIPAGIGLGARMVASNQTIVIKDMRDLGLTGAPGATNKAQRPAFVIASVLAVPIMVGRGSSRPALAGGIFAYNRTAPCARAASAERKALPYIERASERSRAWPFAAEDRTVLEALAASFSSTFDRLQQAETHSLAHTLSRSLLSFRTDEPGLRRLLRAQDLARTVCSIARSTFECEQASLLFVDALAGELWSLRDTVPRRGSVDIRSAAEQNVFLGVERVPLGRGLLAAVVRTREPLMLDNASADPRYDPVADKRCCGTTAARLAARFVRSGDDDNNTGMDPEAKSVLLWPLIDPASRAPTPPLAILALAGKLASPSALAIAAAAAHRSPAPSPTPSEGGGGTSRSSTPSAAAVLRALEAGPAVADSQRRQSARFSAADSAQAAPFAADLLDILLPMLPAIEAARVVLDAGTDDAAGAAGGSARGGDSRTGDSGSPVADGVGGSPVGVGSSPVGVGESDPRLTRSPSWADRALSILRTMQPPLTQQQQQQHPLLGAAAATAGAAAADASASPRGGGGDHGGASAGEVAASMHLRLRPGWAAPRPTADPDLGSWRWSAFDAAAAAASPDGAASPAATEAALVGVEADDNVPDRRLSAVTVFGAAVTVFGAAVADDERLARAALALLDGAGGGGNLLSRCGVPAAKAAALVTSVRAEYLPVPFHGWAHAVNTMQAAALLAAAPEAAAALAPLDRLLLLVAAMGHDMGHRARNNGFEVGVTSELALLHGDDATLERHHAAQLCRVVMDAAGGSDVLAALPSPAVALARRKLLRAILATDMARHMDIVEAMGARKRRAVAAGSGDAPFDVKVEADVEELMGDIVHVADFAGNARTLNDTQEWTARLVAEFRAQAAAEAAHGLPVTPFMAQLDGSLKVAQLQRAFIGGIVAPLWRAAGALLSGLDEPLRAVEMSRLLFEARCNAASTTRSVMGTVGSRSLRTGSAGSKGSRSRRNSAISSVSPATHPHNRLQSADGLASAT